ncbi:MAG: hypothetical protein L6V91_05845 [Bacilli bacterium]|nr:MAG: hypothetical protein L6V91_05845 [Bacilli bacterium]
MFVTGEINVTEEVITTDSINNLIKVSVYSKVDNDYELITVIPLTFTLDGEKVDTAIGKSGKKLGLKGIMITAPKKKMYIQYYQ